MSSDHSVTEPLNAPSNKTGKDSSEPSPDGTSALRSKREKNPDGDVTLDLQTSRFLANHEDIEDDVEEVVFSDESTDDLDSGLRPTIAPPSIEAELMEETDDLADYMQNFLKRMNCGGQAEEAEAETPDTESPEPEEEIDETEQSSYAGPKTAPERKCDLQAMRELANASVKDSLSKHDQIIVRQTQVALTVAICCSILAGTMSLLATDVLGYAFIASLVCFGVAGFSAWRYWSGMKRLASGGSTNGKVEAST